MFHPAIVIEKHFRAGPSFDATSTLVTSPSASIVRKIGYSVPCLIATPSGAESESDRANSYPWIGAPARAIAASTTSHAVPTPKSRWAFSAINPVSPVTPSTGPVLQHPRYCVNHNTVFKTISPAPLRARYNATSMAWIAENRRGTQLEEKTYLTEEMKTFLREKYLPRYPTKRAVLLRALHLVQHAYNWIPTKALAEVAEFLAIQPAEVLDTASFYEEYWLKPKGKYLVQVCRSLACELCGSAELTKRVCDKLKVEVGETTKDGRFTVVELECLGACGTAPVAMVNEYLHETLTADQMEKIISELPEDPHDYGDPTVNWPLDEGPGAHAAGHH